MIRFVLVNNRVPAHEPFCACCARRLDNGYIRERNTDLKYCDLACYGFSDKLAAIAYEESVRRVS
jgi:hypothetical protein